MRIVEEHIVMGPWSETHLDRLIRGGAKITDPGTRIDLLSRSFLGTPYQESTLIGDAKTAEAFVINLAQVDCFTFLDYVEAMRLSNSFGAFKRTLKKVRYRSGRVAFKNRNHFFSDWREYRGDSVADVSGEVGGPATQTVEKLLNIKEDGTHWLPGIVPLSRRMDYIPASAIDEKFLRRLDTGDYVGIYSEVSGLDVSHVGIIIREGDTVYLRHASSSPAHRKVVDQDFLTYMTDKPGCVILRPRNREGREQRAEGGGPITICS